MNPTNLMEFKKEVVAAMYAMYLTGKSCEEIGHLYRKPRQSIYSFFHTRGYALRPHFKHGYKELNGIKFYPDGRGHFKATIMGKRVSMHRYVWEKAKGKVPKGIGVYHKKDIENNDIGNLYLSTS